MTHAAAVSVPETGDAKQINTFNLGSMLDVKMNSAKNYFNRKEPH